MLTNRFLTISIVFIISMFLASTASAAYTLEASTFTNAGGQGNSDTYGLFSSFGQSQPIEVPVGDATSPSFQLFAGFLSSALVDGCNLSAEAGDSYKGDEGSEIQFSGSATGGTEPYTFEWDFDGDGEYDDGTGQNPTHTWYDDWENPIGLRVTDASNCQATDTAPVTVNNVPPTVTIEDCPEETFEGGEASFVWSFTDPGTEDTHTYVLAFGDGSDPASGTAQVNETITHTHIYTTSGRYTVTLTVTDDDEGSDDDNTCVVIVRSDITLTLEDASGNGFIVDSGGNITINLNINTQGKEINGISGYLTFDETYLTIQDADAGTAGIQPFTKGDFLGGSELDNDTHNDTLEGV